MFLGYYPIYLYLFVILLSKVHKERQNLHVFVVKIVDYVGKLSPFFPLSSMLVHIPFQVGTFHVHYANCKN